MIDRSPRWRFLGAVLVFALSSTAAQAAATVRTVPRASVAQPSSPPVGQDSLRSIELAPTFAQWPKMQDGPDVSGSGQSDRDAAALKQARKRFLHRSIARHRGAGEWIPGEERDRPGARLVTSFDGLTMRDQRLANGGNQFSVEPPDQALCVGNGYVVEAVNDVFRVYDRRGNPLTGVIDLNTFYGYPAAFVRPAGPFGPSITDPSCYYDPQVNRFFMVVLTFDVDPASGGALGPNHLDLAVTTTGNPLGPWNVYRIPVQDDGSQGTPVHPDCPCFGDYPHLGADANGIYLTTNEFPFVSGFNAAQIYALSKKDLAKGAVSLTLVQIDTSDRLFEGHPGFTVWPAVSPAGDFATANRGTEFFLSSLAVWADDGNDRRLQVWSLGNTKSLDGNHPDLTLVDNTVRVRPYGVPPLSNQKPGPTPLADCINDRTLVTPFGVGCWNYLFVGGPPPLAVAPELIDSNDSRMQQVFYTGGRLYGALDTAVNVRGFQQAGIAYYALRPFAQNGSVFAVVENEGKIGIAGNNVTYPAIAALPDGRGIVAFTLVGAGFFPSAAYIHLGPNGHQGPIRTAADGQGPDDGFTGYEAYNPGTVNARWGDYGAAAVDNRDFWIASEYIGQSCTLSQYVASPFGSCDATRVALGNWYTRISRVNP